MSNIDEQIGRIKQLIDQYSSFTPIIAFGNGGSASDASHFVAELVGRYSLDDKIGSMFSMDLTSCNAIITAIANDFGYENVFSRQLEGLKMQKAVIGISTSGKSLNVINAFKACRKDDIKIMLTGNIKNKQLDELGVYQHTVSGDTTAEIQENHIKILHYIAKGLKCS